MSKLTEEQNVAIKSSDKPQAQLAKEFGVSAVTIFKLKANLRLGLPAMAVCWSYLLRLTMW